MAFAEEVDYTAFEAKVKRTVYIDNLSPNVSEPILRMAFDQFGTVKSIRFIPNYLGPKNMQQCALVEMENQKQAEAVISVIIQFPFMISGMPRPVRARAAEVEMFDDRPRNPGRKIHCRWVTPHDPDFEIAKKLKHLTKSHALQSAFLLKQQLGEEEKLAKQQAESLKANHKKYEMVDSVIADGTARRLGKYYNSLVFDN